MTGVVWCCQKEENGEILNSLGSPDTMFEQSGLGPGQEYEVKLEVVKNNTSGPAARKNIFTSEYIHSALTEFYSLVFWTRICSSRPISFSWKINLNVESA